MSSQTPDLVPGEIWLLKYSLLIFSTLFYSFNSPEEAVFGIQSRRKVVRRKIPGEK